MSMALFPIYPAKKSPEMKEMKYIKMNMFNASDGTIIYLTINTLLEEDRAPAKHRETLLILFLVRMKARSTISPSNREMSRTMTP